MSSIAYLLNSTISNHRFSLVSMLLKKKMMQKDCLMMNRIKLVVNVYLHVACFSMNEIRWILNILDAKIAVFNLFYLPILLYDCQKIVYQNKKIRNKSVAARTLVLTDALSTILAYLFSHRFLPRFSKLRPATY